MLRFDFAPTRAPNAVEHIAGSTSTPAPVAPSPSNNAADLHRRRIDAYAPPEPTRGAEGTPTFVIGAEPEENEKLPDVTVTNKEVAPSTSPPPPVPALSEPTSSPDVDLMPGDPELSPLAFKGSSRTRSNSREVLASGEIIPPPTPTLESLRGIEPLVFGDPADFVIPTTTKRTRTRTISFDQTRAGSGAKSVRSRSASLGQISALGGEVQNLSRIPRPVGSAMRARAVSAPLASASASASASSLNRPRDELELTVPREIVSPLAAAPAQDAGKKKEDFVLDLQAMHDPDPPSPFLGGLGISLAPISRRTSAATSRSPIPPRPSHPPPMSPRSAVATTSPRTFDTPPRASPRPPAGSSPHSESPRLRNLSLTNDTGAGAAALGWMSTVLSSVVRGAKDLISPTLAMSDSLPLPVSSPAARASGVIGAVANERASASPRVNAGAGRSFVPSVFDSESDGDWQGKDKLGKPRGTADDAGGDRLYLHPRRPTASQSYTSVQHPPILPHVRNRQLRPSKSSVTVGMKASTALSLLSTSANGSRTSLVVSNPVPMPSPERKMGTAEPRKAPVPPATGGITVSDARKDGTGRRPSLLKLASSASKLSLAGIRSVSPTSPSFPATSPPPLNITPSSKGISSPPSSYPSTHHPTPGMTATPTTGTHRTSHSASSTLSSAIDPVNYPVPPPPPAHLAERIFSSQSQRTMFSSPSSPSLGTATTPSTSTSSEPRQKHQVRARRRSPAHTHSRSVSIDMDDLKRAMLPLSPSDDFLVGLGEDPFASMPSTPLLMNAPTTQGEDGYLAAGTAAKSVTASPLAGAFFANEGQELASPMSPGMANVEKGARVPIS